MRPVLYWFDLQENRKGIMKPVGTLEHTEELNGEDVLRFSTLSVPDKYDRLLWRDPEDGRWREHVVVTASQGLGGLCNVRAENSLVDLKAAYLEEVTVTDGYAVTAVRTILTNTAWEAELYGSRDIRHSYFFYHISAYEALSRIRERNQNTEFEALITVEDGRVTSRHLCSYYRLGKGRGLRFQDGRNLHLCRRFISSSEVYTALYGWGASIRMFDDDGKYLGYSRRVGFEDDYWNKTKLPWVGDDDAREKYGLWNTDHTEKVHRFGDVIFAEYEDPTAVLNRTEARLLTVNAPRFYYSVEGAVPAGLVVGLGDPVAISSSRHAERVNCQTRVRKRVRTFGDEVRCKVTLGDSLTYLWNGNLGYGE